MLPCYTQQCAYIHYVVELVNKLCATFVHVCELKLVLYHDVLVLLVLMVLVMGI